MEAQHRRGLTLAATALGSSLAFIDATVVIVALPTISRDLDLGLTGQQWVYLSYSLSLAAFYLVSGALGDRYGRRSVFVAGVVGFALASALCAVAPGEGVLVVARFLQGIGGAVLTTNSLALLRVVYGADRGIGEVWWAVVLAIAALGGFVTWQLRAAEPLLPLDLFRRRNFAAANLETFLVYAALGALLLYLPIYLQFLGFSPFASGLALTPTSVFMILFATRFGALADRRGPRLFLTVGPTLIGCGILTLMLVDERSRFWVAGIPGLALFALGLSMMVAPITSTAISSAPEVLAGIASGVNQTV